MTVTKKDLNTALDTQAESITADIKGYIDESLKQQTQNLKAYTDHQTEALARIVNKAFSAQNKYLAQVFVSRADLQRLKEQMAAHDRKFEAIEQALDVKL